jgi:hypothetical protein
VWVMRSTTGQIICSLHSPTDNGSVWLPQVGCPEAYQQEMRAEAHILYRVQRFLGIYDGLRVGGDQPS